MLVLELVTWWYGDGWLALARRFLNYPKGMYNYFSVALLAKTMFAPWKRITTTASRSLNERLRAMMDNLVSRWVGFSVRLLVLIVASIMMVLSLVVAVVGLVVWPLLPLAVPLLILKMVVPL